VEKIAIFGAAGAIGTAVALELEHRGFPYRVVGRDRGKLERAFGDARNAEVLAADLSDPMSAGDASRGCDTVIYAVGVPYTQFELHPKLMATTVEAAAATGVQRLLVVSSVYSYGRPETPRVAETHPRRPHTIKGRMRRDQEDIALNAQKQGLLRAAVVRLPDFYGPHADQSLANPILEAALDGRKANWLGSVDLPHEFIFVPDAGRTIVDLGSQSGAYGEAWNIGGPGPIPGRDFIETAYREAGQAPQWRTAGKALLWLAGWFKPMMSELVEMSYLHETPVILDDSKLHTLLGSVQKTPYAEGIRNTLEWMRGRRAAGSNQPS
jgi:nucleoside-diphosphate-sugar epimerase